jgi:hypothetical protein
VFRPLEYGIERAAEATTVDVSQFTLAAYDFEDLAEQLGT